MNRNVFMKARTFVCLVCFIHCCSIIHAQTGKKATTSVTILERSKSNDSSGATLKINEHYFEYMEMEEKAALGLLSTLVPGDCKELRLQGKLLGHSCKLTSLLGYQHQCSNEQLSFLRHWFRTDTATLKLLTQEACNAVPLSTTVQESFSIITIGKTKNEIVITCKISGLDTRNAKGWIRQEIFHFAVDANKEQINLKKREQKTLSKF